MIKAMKINKKYEIIWVKNAYAALIVSPKPNSITNVDFARAWYEPVEPGVGITTPIAAILINTHPISKVTGLISSIKNPRYELSAYTSINIIVSKIV